MSFTKRFIEYQDYNDTLVKVLMYLDENDLLPENQIRGIARKVIKKQKPDELNTESQRWHFCNDVVPFMEKITCENPDCNSPIGVRALEEAFNHKGGHGELLCPDCLINRGREDHYRDK
jgi:hypothetical protein